MLLLLTDPDKKKIEDELERQEFESKKIREDIEKHLIYSNLFHKRIYDLLIFSLEKMADATSAYQNWEDVLIKKTLSEITFFMRGFLWEAEGIPATEEFPKFFGKKEVEQALDKYLFKKTAPEAQAALEKLLIGNEEEDKLGPPKPISNSGQLVMPPKIPKDTTEEPKPAVTRPIIKPGQ